MRFKLDVLLVFVLFLATCNPYTQAPADDGLLAATTLYYAPETLAGPDTPRALLILDNARWSVAWDTLFVGWAAGPLPLPAVDFDSSVVLIAARGTTPTQLTSFKIAEVRVRTSALHVTVESVWPCGGLPVLTTPVHVVSVPRVATQSRFTFVNKSGGPGC